MTIQIEISMNEIIQGIQISMNEIIQGIQISMNEIRYLEQPKLIRGLKRRST